MRRGDLKPGKEMVALRVEDRSGWELEGVSALPGLGVIPEVHRVGVALPGQKLAADRELPAGQLSGDRAKGEVLSDTGELWRSWDKRWGWIDTPRSKVAYGFLGQAGKITLKGLELEVQTDYAVIALGSLSEDALEVSQSILRTAVGRCENSGTEYNEDRTRLLSPGQHPIMIEPIEAHIHLKTNQPALKVFVISEHGELVTRLPVLYESGVLSFEIGPQPSWNPSTMYYLIRV